MQEWEGIAEFVAVTELESFTAASKRLGISTAQVSRQITALEKRLNTQLFYRTTRKVSVTDIGKVYYQHCRVVLDNLDEAKRAITDLQSTPTGEIKITAPITFGENIIAPLLVQFADMYPELAIRCQLSNSNLDLVSEGFDLAIRVGKLEDSSLKARLLSTRSVYVCASPEYLEEHQEPQTLSELEQHNCLVGMNSYWRFKEADKERSVKVSGRLSCNSGNALAKAAINGMGVVQLPDHYVKNFIDDGRLITLLSDYQCDEESIWAIYPHNRHLSQKVRLLIDFLNDNLLKQSASIAGALL